MTKMPDPDASLMPSVKWGRPDVLFTPAYWRLQATLCRPPDRDGLHRIGATFHEEVVACMLGGYGIPADVGIAAFHALRDQGVMDLPSVSQSEILRVLTQPILLTNGKCVRYRFAHQKSRFITSFLNSALHPPATSNRKEIRDWLTRFDGIGPKTASWIVRNWFDSDEVAIIDIHLHRAGLLAGFFRPEDNPAKNYHVMERQFLSFAQAIQVRASVLDALIWWQMRRAGRLVLRVLQRYT